MSPKLTGKPCDDEHPFPAPPDGAWTDSVEFGVEDRRVDTGPFPTADVDPTPTWRAMAARIWRSPCLKDHVDEIAHDTILTTHLLAAALLCSESPYGLQSLGFGVIGDIPAIKALNLREGLAPAHAAVQQMALDKRCELVGESLRLIMKGYASLQLDLQGDYMRKRN